MNKIIILPVIVILITILYLPQDAHAATSYELQANDANGDCETMTGTWDSGTNTCTLTTTLTTLNAGDSLQIDTGVTFGIPNGKMLTNSGTINNFGTINIPGRIHNFGILNNDGTINIDRLPVNGGVLINCGATTTCAVPGPTGVINNNHYGTINDYDTFQNFNIITNDGFLNIYNVGIFDNHGTYTNSGDTIINLGTIIYNGRVFVALISNSGDIHNFGTIYNCGSSKITGNPVLESGPIIQTDNCPFGNPNVPEFPIPFSLVIIFIAITAMYLAIRQKMTTNFKRF